MLQGALTIATKAARQAGSVILRHMNKLDSVPVEEKGRNDFVSEVDRQAESEIIRELKRAFPRHAYLGEESGLQGQGKFCWVIDPLDGTHNYLRGFPHFCVSIALLENGEPRCAVVFDPLRNEIFGATRGRGAFINERRIRVAGRASLKDALLVTGFPFRQRRHIEAHLGMTRALLSDAGAEDIRRTGSAALDLAYVACGRIDGYWEIGLKPWDIAAGWLLVREAGGKVSDFSGGEDFMKTGNVIAGNLKIAEAMRATIAPYLTAEIAR